MKVLDAEQIPKFLPLIKMALQRAPMLNGKGYNLEDLSAAITAEPHPLTAALGVEVMTARSLLIVLPLPAEKQIFCMEQRLDGNAQTSLMGVENFNQEVLAPYRRNEYIEKLSDSRLVSKFLSCLNTLARDPKILEDISPRSAERVLRKDAGKLIARLGEMSVSLRSGTDASEENVRQEIYFCRTQGELVKRMMAGWDKFCSQHPWQSRKIGLEYFRAVMPEQFKGVGRVALQGLISAIVLCKPQALRNISEMDWVKNDDVKSHGLRTAMALRMVGVSREEIALALCGRRPEY